MLSNLTTHVRTKKQEQRRFVDEHYAETEERMTKIDLEMEMKLSCKKWSCARDGMHYLKFQEFLAHHQKCLCTAEKLKVIDELE